MASFQFLQLPLELEDKVLECHFSRRFDLRTTQHLISVHAHAEVGHRKVYAAGDLTPFCPNLMENYFLGNSSRALTLAKLNGEKVPITRLIPTTSSIS